MSLDCPRSTQYSCDARRRLGDRRRALTTGRPRFQEHFDPQKPRFDPSPHPGPFPSSAAGATQQRAVSSLSDDLAPLLWTISSFRNARRRSLRKPERILRSFREGLGGDNPTGHGNYGESTRGFEEGKRVNQDGWH